MDRPAIIFQHPSAPVVLEPRDHRLAVSLPPHETEEEQELLAVADGLTALIQKHGAPRIMRLVRMLAHLAGQEV